MRGSDGFRRNPVRTATAAGGRQRQLRGRRSEQTVRRPAAGAQEAETAAVVAPERARGLSGLGPERRAVEISAAAAAATTADTEDRRRRARLRRRRC